MNSGLRPRLVQLVQMNATPALMLSFLPLIYPLQLGGYSIISFPEYSNVIVLPVLFLFSTGGRSEALNPNLTALNPLDSL